MQAGPHYYAISIDASISDRTIDQRRCMTVQETGGSEIVAALPSASIAMLSFSCSVTRFCCSSVLAAKMSSSCSVCVEQDCGANPSGRRTSNVAASSSERFTANTASEPSVQRTATEFTASTSPYFAVAVWSESCFGSSTVPPLAKRAVCANG